MVDVLPKRNLPEAAEPWGRRIEEIVRGIESSVGRISINVDSHMAGFLASETGTSARWAEYHEAIEQMDKDLAENKVLIDTTKEQIAELEEYFAPGGEFDQRMGIIDQAIVDFGPMQDRLDDAEAAVSALEEKLAPGGEFETLLQQAAADVQAVQDSLAPTGTVGQQLADNATALSNLSDDLAGIDDAVSQAVSEAQAAKDAADGVVADVATSKADAELAKTMAEQAAMMAINAVGQANKMWKQADNRVFNPSFEEDISGWPLRAGFTIITITDSKDGGTYAMKADPVNQNPERGYYQSQSSRTYIAPGRVARVGGWVRLAEDQTVPSNSTDVARIYIQGLSSGSSQIGEATPVEVLATSLSREWTWVEGTYTIPTDWQWGVTIGIGRAGDDGISFEFDALVMQDVTEAAAAQKKADQAAADAAAAKDAADAAEALAAGAQASADDAMGRATTADGRYTVALVNPTTEDAEGKPLNAVWEVRSGGVMERMYVLTGPTTWTLMSNAAVTAAQEAADTAKSVADSAQLTADGKNKIIRSTSAASSPANYSAGDQWWRYSGSQVIGFWLHNGSAWVSQTLTDSVITNLSAGTITTGTLSADRLGARTITADKLFVTDSTNLIADVVRDTSSVYPHAPGPGTLDVSSGAADANGVDPGLHLFAVRGDAAAGTWSTLIQFGGPNGTTSFPAAPNTDYYFSVLHRLGGTYPNGVGAGRVAVRCLDKNGTSLQFTTANGTFSPGWAWGSFETTFTTHPETATISVSIQSDSPASGFRLALPTLREMNAGKLVVDGSITASQMKAGTITAASGIIGDAAIGTAQIADGVITNAKIGDLDVGKLTASGTSKFQTAVMSTLLADDAFVNRLVAERVVITGMGDNIVANGMGELRDVGGWCEGLNGVYWQTSDMPAGTAGAFMTLPGTGVRTSSDPLVPITADELLVEIWLKADKPNSRIYVELRNQAGGHASSGNTILPGSQATSNTPGLYLLNSQLVPTEWTKYTIIARPTAATTHVRLGSVHFNHSGGTEKNAKQSILIRARPRNAGELVVDGGIVARHLSADSVTAAAIKAGTITATEIASNAITTVKIAANAVTTAKIAANAVTANEIAAKTITANEIAANTITASQIAANAITSSELATNALLAGRVLITSTSNLLVNPRFMNNGEGWSQHSNLTYYTNGGKDNSPSMLVAASTSQTGSYLGSNGSDYRTPIVGDHSYSVSAWVRPAANVSPGGIGFYLRTYTTAGSSSYSFATADGGTSTVSNNTETLPGGTWTRLTGWFTAPPSAVEASVGLYVQSSANVSVRFSDPALTAMASGELIVDGAITARNIASQTITAAEIASNAITSVKIASGQVTTVKLAAGAVTAEKITADSALVNKLMTTSLMSGKITTGMFELGDNVRWTDDGLYFYTPVVGNQSITDWANRQALIAITPTGDSSITVSSDGEPTGGIDPDGSVWGHSGSFDSLEIAGTPLVNYDGPRGAMSAVTLSANTTLNTTERVLIRDKFTPEAGRLYRFTTHFSMAGTQSGYFSIRASANPPVGVGNTSLAREGFDKGNGASGSETYINYIPGSVLAPSGGGEVEIGYSAVTAAGTVNIWAGSGSTESLSGTYFLIEDAGPEIPFDVATASTPTNTTPPPPTKKTYTKTYKTTGVKRYNSAGSPATDSRNITAGSYFGSAMSEKLLYQMPASFYSDLSGATIKSAKITIRCTKTYYGSSIKVYTGITTTSGLPSSMPSYTNTNLVTISPGKTVTVAVPSSYYNNVKSGRGLTIVPQTAASLASYGYFDASTTQITVTYVK